MSDQVDGYMTIEDTFKALKEPPRSCETCWHAIGLRHPCWEVCNRSHYYAQMNVKDGWKYDEGKEH